ncbi:MAG: VTT domain-containing protein [Candidatus Binatia bacterium]
MGQNQCRENANGNANAGTNLASALRRMSVLSQQVGQQPPLCVEGRNCWRIAPATRAAFLIDGAAYFEAFAAAAARARESIFLVGWDFHSQVRLVRDGRRRHSPTELRAYLNSLVAGRRDLHIYILLWDFAMIYALEREVLPIVTKDWRTHRRVHFVVDGCHPVGASHHQKIIVIDDAVAFVGGIDLTRNRWDTPAHQANDPRRVNEDGRPYRPFHDVQMLVAGEAAAALGDLVRERWRRATGKNLRVPAGAAADPWPSGVLPEMKNVNVAISRTEPAYEEHPPIHEVEALYCDTIAAARQYIYIENQYLTSAVIGDALTARLREPQGPEIVLVLPQNAPGWLEESTMDILRARLLRQLHGADKCGRLRVYHPTVPGLGNQAVTVHAKILVVDDRLVRVGSSNLSNRSMGLDTECDLTVEAADDERTEDAIAHFRNRLLGEHLGVSPTAVGEMVSTTGSLVRGIEALRGNERTLVPLEDDTPAWALELAPDAIIDPERPVDPDTLIAEIMPPEDRRSGGRALVRGALLLVLLLAGVALWRWTPLADGVDAQALVQWVTRLRATPSAPHLPVMVLAAYLLGSVVLVPVTLLIVATIILVGPVLGVLYAFTGCVLSAMVTYGVGAWLGRDVVRHFAGSRVNRLSQQLARHGVLAVVTVRVIPVAPFTIVNLVAGASHIGFRDFVTGTALGMGPGILVISLFASQLEHTAQDPSLDRLLLLAGITLLMGLAALWIRRRLTPGNR